MACSFAAMLRQVKADLLSFVPVSMIQAAISASGHRFRNRKLPPAVLVPLMLVQAIHGNTAIRHLRHLTRFAASPEAFCKARRLLPLEILHQLAMHLADAAVVATEPKGRWKPAAVAACGEAAAPRVFVLDAFSFSVSNNAALCEALGKPAGRGGHTAGTSEDQRKPAFPFGHALAMVDHHSGCIVDLVVGPGHQSDVHGVNRPRRRSSRTATWSRVTSLWAMATSAPQLTLRSASSTACTCWPR